MNTQVLVTMSPDDLRDLIRSEVATAIRNVDDRFLSQAEMCRRLRVDSRTFQQMGLPAYKVGRSLRFKISDVPQLTTKR